MKDEETSCAGKVLVHVCCAACYLGVAQELQGAGVAFEGYFYNPNVHGLLEFRRRLKACKQLAHDVGLAMTFDEEYGLARWLDAVAGRETVRCETCWRMRLERTAEVARERGFGGFTTTLLASLHQDHEKVREVGREVGQRAGVEFVYHDWRPAHERGCEEAKRRSLYRQQYCGCIYSEYERFRDTGRHLWRGGEDAQGTL